MPPRKAPASKGPSLVAAAVASSASAMPPPPPPPSSSPLSAAVSSLLLTHFDAYQRAPSASERGLPKSRALQVLKELASLASGGAPAGAVLEASTACLSSLLDHFLSADKSASGPADAVRKLILTLCGPLPTVSTDGGQTPSADVVPSLDFVLSRALLRCASTPDLFRARAATLVGEVLSSLSSDSSTQSLSSDLHDQCIEVLRPLLLDKSQAVRVAAIRSCLVLQDPEESESDPITLQLLHSLVHDPSPACRAAAVSAIAVSRFTLPALVTRCRDVCVTVRVAALDVLRSEVDVKLMTEGERIVAVRAGITNRCEQTYKAASRMIVEGWLRSLAFSPIKLLKLLDVSNNEAVCELAIKAILKAPDNMTLKDFNASELKAYKDALDKPVDINKLTVASAFFLRVKIGYLKDDASLSPVAKANALEGLMPDTPIICSAIQKHLGKLLAAFAAVNKDDTMTSVTEDEETGAAESFIALQLLKLARMADFSEESGRNQCLSLLHGMLCSAQTPDELVDACIRALAVAHKFEADYILRISDVVKEVSDYDAEDSEMDANDAAFRQLRVVSIVGVVLEHTRRSLDDEVIKGMSDLILPAIASTDDLVREAGVSCLGKYAMLGRGAAEEFKPLLLSIAANEAETSEIRAQALMAMCDLAMLWEGMTSECECMGFESEEPTIVSLPSMLLRIFDFEAGGMVAIAAEVCSKLLMMGKIQDADIMSKLLMVYFDPKFTKFVGGPSGIDGDLDENGAEDVDGEEFKAAFSAGQAIALAAEKQVETDAEDAMEVGSPIRMQQLLSIFFEGFVVVKPERAAFMGECAARVIALSGEKWTAGKDAASKASAKPKKGKAKAVEQVPLDKVLLFISTVGNASVPVGIAICEHVSATTKALDANVIRDFAKVLCTLNVVKFDEAAALRERAGEITDVFEEANKTVAKNFCKFLEMLDSVQEERAAEKAGKVVDEVVRTNSSSTVGDDEIENHPPDDMQASKSATTKKAPAAATKAGGKKAATAETKSSTTAKETKGKATAAAKEAPKKRETAVSKKKALAVIHEA